MNSVTVATENEDEFQKKTDAVSEILAASEFKDTRGVNVSNIISVERSVIKGIESLNLLGQYPFSMDLNSFLLSTLEDNVISQTANLSNDICTVEEDLPVLGIILFALYQQRCNNPPDSRFEVAPEPQILDEKLIPFSIEVSCDENTVTTIFNTSNSSCELNIDPENNMAYDNDVERIEDQDDERLPAVENDTIATKKRRGGRPKKITTTILPTMYVLINNFINCIHKVPPQYIIILLQQQQQHESAATEGSKKIPRTNYPFPSRCRRRYYY